MKSTIRNSIPVEIEAACMVFNPPPTRSAIATAPSIKAHKIRCPTGAFSFPPEVMLSITREPLSDEVTKNTETIKIPIKLVIAGNGNCLRNTNNEVEESAIIGPDNNPG